MNHASNKFAGKEYGNFDFDLSATDEARAATVHAEAIVIDLLFGYPGGHKVFEIEPYKSLARKLELELQGWALGDAMEFVPYSEDIAGRSTFMRDEWAATGITGGHCGMYLDLSKVEEPQPAIELCKQVPWLHIAYSVDQIRRIKAAGEHFFIGNCQPVFAFPRRLDVIEKAYAAGLRSLMLSYNYSNGVACGCTERIDHGITNFGVDVIRECNTLGIIVDTSHVGRASTLEACSLSKAPVTANHTCANALFDHARAKSDEEIKAIAATGGLVGLCCVPYFYSRSPATADIGLVLDHIDYIAELVGPEYIAIGSDGPACMPKDMFEQILNPATLKEMGFRPEDNIQLSVNFKGFDDYRDYIKSSLINKGIKYASRSALVTA